MARVLIIEDDPVMQKMYRRVFEFEGFEVAQANDGKVGLEMAQTTSSDMILLDIMMPVLSGLQVLDALKSNPVTERIPVMVFTNLGGKQDADAVLAKGAVACVHKSEVNPKQVVQMVRDELSRRGVMVPEMGMSIANS
jgi:CheY-like chemotaxis protein